MMKKDISANLQQKCLIFCSKVLLKVQRNMTLKVLLPWQHTRFQTSPILKAFLATYSVLFTYLQMVPCVYDPAGIYICYLQFVALFDVFRAENHQHIKIKWVGTGTE